MTMLQNIPAISLSILYTRNYFDDPNKIIFRSVST